MSEIELKPCPFCGKIPFENDEYIMCSFHGCQSDDLMELEAWQRRPIEDALKQRCDAMENDIAELTEIHRKEFERSEALYRRIAELEAAQRWIPVSERMPERNSYVLAVTEFAGVEIVKFGRSFLAFTGQKVSHWMPLPLAPEMHEEEPINGYKDIAGNVHTTGSAVYPPWLNMLPLKEEDGDGR